MTDTEILQKVIKKAEKGGYQLPEDWSWCDNHEGIFDMGWGDEGCHIPDDLAISRIIFSHDFAKALWESEPYIMGEMHDQHFKGEKVQWFGGFPYWQYQLMRMAIEENPLQYLAKFL